MTREQSVRYEMFVRVWNFGQTHSQVFAEAAAGGEALAAVEAAVDQLKTYAKVRWSAERARRRARQVARQEVAERLGAIARTARVIDMKSPGFADRFRVPRPRTSPLLLIAGRAFAHEAANVVDRFIAYGLPATFIADLEGSVQKFERAIRDREAAESEQAAARMGMSVAFTAGLDAVRTLDVIVANRHRADDVVFELWKHERRLDSVRRSRTPNAAAASTTANGEAPAATSPAAAPRLVEVAKARAPELAVRVA